MIRIVMILLCLTLAACGGRPAPRATPIHGTFQDADPYDWDHRGPKRYPVHGVDVSKYQGDIDWATLQQGGAAFAFIKATEGGDRVDSRFMDNWRGAARAGLPRGAYHFFYLCGPAEAQARWFIANVPRAANALPPVLDMEWTPFSPTCTIRPPQDQVRAEARRFIEIVTAHYGKRPILYTSVDFYQDNDLGRLQGVDFWLRSVAGHPSEKFPGQNWTFWQYTSTGLVPGITGRADLNVFGGSKAEWSAYLR
ncbi:MAG: GH25 family lysozyme [Cypionkella sp.]|nr:glycoside hydrolase family 25 protein [Cypionkella sp.]